MTEPDPFCKSLYIGDLPPWMDENYIFGLLATTGEVVSVKVIRNKVTSVSEGYGFIEFVSHEAAEKNLRTYNGTTMADTGLPFRMNWAVFGQGKVARSPAEALLSDHSLFVGDLAPEVTDSMLLQHFRQYFISAIHSRIIIDPATGRSKGYGFVRFTNEYERDQAIQQLNGSYLGSKTIRVGEARKPSGTAITAVQCSADPYNTTLFVGNISPSITEEYLKGVFAHFGEIVYVKIPSGRNCGFVQFVERNAAESALNTMNNQVLLDCTIRVSWGRTRTAMMTPVPQPVQVPAYQYQYPSGYVMQAPVAAMPMQDPNAIAAHYGYPSAEAYAAAYYASYGMYPVGFPVVGFQTPRAATAQEAESDNTRAPDNVERMNREYIDRHLPRLTGRCIKIP